MRVLSARSGTAWQPLAWGALFVALASLAPSGAARAQFEPANGTLPMEDTGTIEDINGHVVRVKDSKNDTWLMQITDDTYVRVEGEARPSYLKPGMLVQFWGTIDKKGTLEYELDEIEILPTTTKVTVGLFDEDDTSPQAKPLKNPSEGSYFIRGKVASFRNGQIAVTAGSKKVNGEVTDDTYISLSFDDAEMAEQGDAVKVKAWYFENARPVQLMNRPGQAVLEELTITLSAPLGSEKKGGAKKAVR